MSCHQEAKLLNPTNYGAWWSYFHARENPHPSVASPQEQAEINATTQQPWIEALNPRHTENYEGSDVHNADKPVS